MNLPITPTPAPAPREYNAEDQVFSVCPGEFRILVNGKVHSAVWPDRGSALAGLRTEQRRQQNKDQ